MMDRGGSREICSVALFHVLEEEDGVCGDDTVLTRILEARRSFYIGMLLGSKLNSGPGVPHEQKWQMCIVFLSPMLKT